MGVGLGGGAEERGHGRRGVGAGPIRVATSIWTAHPNGPSVKAWPPLPYVKTQSRPHIGGLRPEALNHPVFETVKQSDRHRRLSSSSATGCVFLGDHSGQRDLNAAR